MVYPIFNGKNLGQDSCREKSKTVHILSYCRKLYPAPFASTHFRALPRIDVCVARVDIYQTESFVPYPIQ